MLNFGKFYALNLKVSQTKFDPRYEIRFASILRWI